MQLVDLSAVQAADLDPRLADLAGGLAGSSAVVVNVDYPLGMAAYYLLREVFEAADDVRGVYVLGKAATLNGAIGDILVADVVFDEHSQNSTRSRTLSAIARWRLIWSGARYWTTRKRSR